MEPSSSCGESESPSSGESESAEKEKDGSCLPAVKLAKDCKRCKSSERGMDLGADLASSGIAENFHPNNFL